MIKDFTIVGFKGFERLELKRLSQITLIGGKNNLGKSSLLEAMFLFLDRKNVGMFIRQQSWRGIVSLPGEPQFLWGPFFHNFDLKTPIRLSVESRKEELSLTYMENYQAGRTIQLRELAGTAGGQATISGKAIAITHRRNTKNVSKAYLVLDAGGLAFVDESVQSQNIEQAIYLGSRFHGLSDDVDRLGKVDIKGETQELIDAMKIFDSRVGGFSVIKSGEQALIYADLGLPKKIPVGFAGEGFSRALSIILSILTVPGGIVFIDEIENGVHHSILDRFWNAMVQSAKRHNVQLIVTTHSAELIQAAEGAFLGDDTELFTYLRLGKDKNGKPQVFAFDHAGVSSALQSELEVR